MENKQSYNLIIDTNIWVGAIMGIRVREYLRKILLSTQFTILLNKELLAEISEVFGRNKFKKYINEYEITEMLALIRKRSQWIEGNLPIEQVRDVKDNFLLSLAVVGNADFLITGDDDLLVLENYQATSIIKLSTFIAYFNF